MRATNRKRRSPATAAAIKRWPTARARKWVADLLERAKHDPAVLAVVALGSAVRAGVPSADLDLLMISRGTKPRLRVPLEIDLRTYDAAEVPRHIADGGDLLGWSIKFGKLLFQRDGYWDKLEKTWAHRLPLPPAAVARERARQAHRRLREMAAIGDLDAARELALSYATHVARAQLLEHGVYPASRPELPGQLRAIGRDSLAADLESLMNTRSDHRKVISELASHAPSRVANDIPLTR